MKVETWSCDNCGKAKKVANHWLMLKPYVCAPDPLKGMLLVHWDDSNAKYYNHACGQECVFAMLTRWMGTGKFEREALVPGSFEKKGAA